VSDWHGSYPWTRGRGEMDKTDKKVEYLSHEKWPLKIPGAFKMKLFSISFLCATLTAALQISVESTGGNSSIFQYGLMLEVQFQSN